MLLNRWIVKFSYMKRNSVFNINNIPYGLWIYVHTQTHSYTRPLTVWLQCTIYNIKYRNESFWKSMFVVWLLLFHKYEHNSILCCCCFFPCSALKKQEMCLWKRYVCVFFWGWKFLVVFVNAMMENTNHNKNKRIRKLNIFILIPD